MRRQKIFHKEFNPDLHDGISQTLYDGVYVPNMQLQKENRKQDVNDFARAKGNIAKCAHTPRYS